MPESKTTDTLDLTPSWLATMRLLITAIEDGTPEGRSMAKGELYNLARGLDTIQKRMAALGGSLAPIESMISSPGRVLTAAEKEQAARFGYAMTGLANACTMLRGNVLLGYRQADEPVEIKRADGAMFTLRKTGDDTIWHDVDAFTQDLHNMLVDRGLGAPTIELGECDDGFVRLYADDQDVDGHPTGPVVLQPVYGAPGDED